MEIDEPKYQGLSCAGSWGFGSIYPGHAIIPKQFSTTVLKMSISCAHRVCKCAWVCTSVCLYVCVFVCVDNEEEWELRLKQYKLKILFLCLCKVNRNLRNSGTAWGLGLSMHRVSFGSWEWSGWCLSRMGVEEAQGQENIGSGLVRGAGTGGQSLDGAKETQRSMRMRERDTNYGWNESYFCLTVPKGRRSFFYFDSPWGWIGAVIGSILPGETLWILQL